MDDLDVVKDQMDDVSISRAHYVITENDRTLDAVRYLSRFDYPALGLVMNQSFESMSESLEVVSFHVLIKCYRHVLQKSNS